MLIVSLALLSASPVHVAACVDGRVLYAGELPAADFTADPDRLQRDEMQARLPRIAKEARAWRWWRVRGQSIDDDVHATFAHPQLVPIWNEDVLPHKAWPPAAKPAPLKYPEDPAKLVLGPCGDHGAIYTSARVLVPPLASAWEEKRAIDVQIADTARLVPALLQVPPDHGNPLPPNARVSALERRPAFKDADFDVVALGVDGQWPFTPEFTGTCTLLAFVPSTNGPVQKTHWFRSQVALEEILFLRANEKAPWVATFLVPQALVFISIDAKGRLVVETRAFDVST